MEAILEIVVGIVEGNPLRHKEKPLDHIEMGLAEAQEFHIHREKIVVVAVESKGQGKVEVAEAIHRDYKNRVMKMSTDQVNKPVGLVVVDSAIRKNSGHIEQMKLWQGMRSN